AEVIGMNTAAASIDGFDSTVGFAIPSNTVRSVIAKLEAHSSDGGKLVLGLSAFLGVSSTLTGSANSAPRQTSGVTIGSVIAGSPAARVGLEPGDSIVSIGTERLVGPDPWGRLAKVLSRHKPGDNILITYRDVTNTSRSVALRLAGIPR